MPPYAEIDMQTSEGLQTLTLEEIAKIDGGRISACFQRELRRCVEDIDDRPADKRDREITITFKLTPEAGEADGLLDGAKLQAQVCSKVPSYRSKKYDFGVRDGQLRFSTSSPTNHRAQPLPFGEDESEDYS